jgi:hypothetical protein
MDINDIRNLIKEELNRINGRVLAYHGTPHGDFDSFDPEKRGTGADEQSFGDFGNGFYFTPNKDNAIAYAEGLSQKEENPQPAVYTVYLTMVNPFSFDKLVKYNNIILDLAKKHGGILQLSNEHFQQAFTAADTTEEEIDFIRDIESDMDDNWMDMDFAERLSREGYDSVISHNGQEYVVFKPEQIEIIKSEPLKL